MFVTRCCSWSKHCATSRKVAGSIPDGGGSLRFSIDLIFPAALWPLTEMSTRNISWR